MLCFFVALIRTSHSLLFDHSKSSVVDLNNPVLVKSDNLLIFLMDLATCSAESSLYRMD